MTENKEESKEEEEEFQEPECENCGQQYGAESKLARLDVFRFLNVPCEWCGEKSIMEKYHHSAIIPHTWNGVKHPGEYIITCPKCNKEMTLIFSLEKRGEKK